MIRDTILTQLARYQNHFPDESGVTVEMIDFIRENPDCFKRELLKGHVTGSAWIVDTERTHALLIHHVKLDKWLQPGGHCDGDPDVIGVALKEVLEETGLTVTPLSEEIFDVDIHPIPERKGIPGHLHYDIRYLVSAPRTTDDLPVNHEVNEIRWIPFDQLPAYSTDASLLRMLEKSKKEDRN